MGVNDQMNMLADMKATTLAALDHAESLDDLKRMVNRLAARALVVAEAFDAADMFDRGERLGAAAVTLADWDVVLDDEPDDDEALELWLGAAIDTAREAVTALEWT